MEPDFEVFKSWLLEHYWLFHVERREREVPRREKGF
jgi:hypothetical protein